MLFKQPIFNNQRRETTPSKWGQSIGVRQDVLLILLTTKRVRSPQTLTRTNMIL